VAVEPPRIVFTLPSSGSSHTTEPPDTAMHAAGLDSRTLCGVPGLKAMTPEPLAAWTVDPASAMQDGKETAPRPVIAPPSSAIRSTLAPCELDQ
jgi:hypothetical protein